MRKSADAAWAFERYREIRHRLPAVDILEPAAPEPAADLGAIANRFDAFLFDSFGVLNVGATAIAGAAERIANLRALGKKVFVLTNAASLPLRDNPRKYTDLGFDFSQDEIVSSRAVLAEALPDFDPGMTWGVAAPASSDIAELPCRAVPLEGPAFETCDGIILLSSAGWTNADQEKLAAALAKRPRPLLVGNPDLVAPREDGFSVEPGACAHDIADRLGIEPVFFGKPYGNAFDIVRKRLRPGIGGNRVLMLGDTLHTDILGGQAAGFATALVTDHGLMRGMDIEAAISAARIAPDYILPSI